MKNTLILIFAATTLALGVLCIAQWRQLTGQKAEIVTLRSESEQASQQLRELETARRQAEEQRRELQSLTHDLSGKLGERPRARTQHDPSASAGAAAGDDVEKPAETKAGLGSLIAKMMDDPETRKLIRAQQRMVLDQLYNPLVKKLELAPDEAAQFKELLAENMMKGAEKATSLFGGDSSTNRTEAIKNLAEEQKTFDEQVRGFLGETKYAQYKEYQQTLGERTQLNQFRQQTAGGEAALSEEQTEQLLAIMREEKQAVAAATGQPPPGETQDAAQMEALLSGDGTERILQSQETVNRQVLERVKDVLTPAQLESFGQFQTNQLQMMRMGMTMARKFLAPEKPESAGPPSPRP